MGFSLGLVPGSSAQCVQRAQNRILPVTHVVGFGWILAVLCLSYLYKRKKIASHGIRHLEVIDDVDFKCNLEIVWNAAISPSWFSCREV